MTPSASGAGVNIDPITVEIAHNALKSITDEMFVSLMKSAYSTNIKERRDHSTAIVDTAGRLVAQADFSLPIHLGSMLGLMEALLAKHALSAMAPGDVFAANDPFVAGGTHLPDINLAMPVFAEGRVVAFVCNIAHHADMGGMCAGSMAGGMSEIYQEGFRLPVVRLFRQGVLQEDLFEVMLLNARLPEERRGDYHAQIASCRLGERRLGELAAKLGASRLEAVFADVLARTEERLRRAFAALPDGSWTFRDVMDDDGCGATDIPIAVTVTVRGRQLTVDFAGTSPQVRGNINCTMSATRSAVCYTLKALLDPDIPNNHGVIAAIGIQAERGSLVDAVFPAAVASRAHTCQRIIDALIGALAPAMPERAVAAANGANTTAVFAGRDPRSGRDYVYLETIGGGFGGRATKDGRDGVQVHITNTSNLPVEAIEAEYPLFVESYGFVPDSAGPGEFRGGLGLRRVVRPIGHEAVFSGTGERFRNPPWGLFGGAEGARGRFLRLEADGRETLLPGKAADVRFGPAQCVVLETAGAGGYGPPDRRPAAAIRADLAAGKLSPGFVARAWPGLPPEEPTP